MLETWQLRAKFAAALSRMYGAEVPAYTTLVEVSAEVNRELGASERVTAERHGAIRVGSASELADVADLFAAFGMYPVGFYDLRDAEPPVPVVSTAFRPIDTDQLDRNPFRVFTSMLATADGRFFPPELRGRVERFLAERQLFDPALIAEARRIAADGGAERERANEFVAAAVAAFALSREPIDRGWYAGADRGVGGGGRHRRCDHHAHQPPDAAGARHRRAVPEDDRARHHDDRCDPGPTALRTVPMCCCGRRRFGRWPNHGASAMPTAACPTARCACASVRSRRAASPSRPKGRQRYDAAMAAADPAAVWGEYFPATDQEMATSGLAYYHGGDPSKPVVYEDFLPASAAGIFRSNLDSDAPGRRRERADDSHYSLQWMAGQIGHHIHDPYELYEKAASS